MPYRARIARIERIEQQASCLSVPSCISCELFNWIHRIPGMDRIKPTASCPLGIRVILARHGILLIDSLDSPTGPDFKNRQDIT
jgi:hypothetical protein